MATKEKEKKERKDLPFFLFFLGAGASIFLILRLNKKGPASAKINGILDDDGGALTSVYFEWGETEELGKSTVHADGVTPGTEFSYILDGLKAEKTYYFRAVAVNAAGVSYGDILSFET
jgi:hypothetical protein